MSPVDARSSGRRADEPRKLVTRSHELRGDRDRSGRTRDAGFLVMQGGYTVYVAVYKIQEQGDTEPQNG